MSIQNKRKFTIWVCEDNKSLWEFQKELLKEYFPKASVKFFLNAGYATRATGNPDIIVIDIGGLMGLGCDIISLTRYNIEGLSNLYPGAIFIINSAIGIYAKDVYDELKPECRAISRWADGCNMGEDIRTIIEEYIS